MILKKLLNSISSSEFYALIDVTLGIDKSMLLSSSNFYSNKKKKTFIEFKSINIFMPSFKNHS